MACIKVVQARRDITAYLPSIHSVLSVVRRSGFQARVSTKALCSDSTSHTPDHVLSNQASSKAIAASWPLDPKFPLPGNSAIDVTQIANSYTPGNRSPHKTLAAALLEVEDEDMKKYRVLNQFIDAKDDEMTMSTGLFNDMPANIVEFTASSCPEKLATSFKRLFTGFPDGNALTVLNICQKTQHDMSAWSSEVEVERELLLETFIKNATGICEQLRNAGFWADFVDPSSGQAFFSEHSNETLFETDERYTHLGFEIDDLGCCKVVRHKMWGTHIFLGTIFTNAPSDSELLTGFSHAQ